MLGAVYIDQGLDAAAGLVHRLFDPLIDEAATLGAGLDWKTSLQELTATAALGVPEYLVSRDRAGPREGLHRGRPGRRRALRRGQRPQQEGGRAGGSGHRLAAPAGRAAGRARSRQSARPDPTAQTPMPELPEVEVVRRGLERWVAGRTVAAVEVAHPRAVRRHAGGGADFAAAPARPDPRPAPAAAASTCGCRCRRSDSHRTRRCSPTSA